MLTLSLLRHAKSSWDNPELDDFDRALAPRGIKACHEIGKAIRARHLCPDLILCSTAVRARATLTLILPELGTRVPEIRFFDDLYLTPTRTILEVLRRNARVAHHVMIIAHNPGIHALALELTGNGERKELGELATKFPTATLAVITFNAPDWDSVRAGGGHLEHFLTPRALKD